MTEGQFDVELRRLIEAFPGKSLESKERMKILWSQVKHVSPRTFKKAVTNLISSEKFTPTINQVSSETRRLHREEIKFKPMNEGPPKCSECRDFGNILKTEVDTGLKIAFRCVCEAGAKLAKNYVLLEKKNEGRYL